ncbi:MAG TPA: class I SAM-dependent methyltransferase [Pyrinomonadaceae bacterium]
MTAQNATRVGPVYFQPLEQELRPVARYLSGHLLNAGCGNRNVSAYLLANAATKITDYDIASQYPEVIVGPLESMPFEDATFDSVLCNAVLEHVANAEDSMRELARVVRPNGHVVVAVPFLQPFHACPTDFRRYTADGLAALGRRAGLDVVCVLPVHSIAQTLGWILWEYAQEKGGRLRRFVAWAVAYTATRLWKSTDTTVVRNANTFQAVFRRPPQEGRNELANAWRERAVPDSCADVPTMLVPDELRLLHYLADDYYTGEGAIVDAGCFLGGSTLALADGLRRNLRRRGCDAEKLIHSYDRFEIEAWTLGSYFPKSAQAGESFRPLFDRNLAPYADLVEVHGGDIRSHPWTGGPIEILFIDVAKHWTVCDWVTWQFFPHLIPGKSVVIQQDYLYHHWVAWLHVTMEFYSDYFEYVCDTGVNSVVFLNTKRIPEGVLRERTVESLTTAEKIELMDRAAARFTGEQARVLRSAKQHFLEMLGES